MLCLKTFTGYAIILGAALMAQASLLALGLFLFYGSFELVKLGMGDAGSLIFDVFLSALFFAQHSGMVRKSFRHWLARFIETGYHGALFTIATGIVLMMILFFWQKTPFILFSAQGMMRWLIRGAYFLIIAGFAWSASSLQPFDPMGLTPIANLLRGEASVSAQLNIRGPYRWVRHPLYLFSILIIWACPEMTADRLLFDVLWTIWIITGAFLEERDLAASFGKSYRTYQRHVPMLIPKSFRPVL